MDQPNQNPIPRYLRRTGAAQHVEATWGLPCSPKYLAKLAVTGGGPVFRKLGRIPLYTASDLDKWAESKLSEPVHSTAELKGAGHKSGPRVGSFLNPLPT